MKKTVSLLLAVLLAVTCALAASAVGFTDVSSGSYYAEAAQYSLENGLIAGTGNGEFSPNMQLSRGMLATILWRNEGRPAASASAFTDVKAGAYYAQAVGWAAENKIVSGYGNGLFGPEDDVERQQAATMLYNYGKYKGFDMTVDLVHTFTDSSSIAGYAKTPVAWAYDRGVISGKGGNLFDPTGNATRAEAVTMVYRYITKVEKADPDDKKEETETPGEGGSGAGSGSEGGSEGGSSSTPAPPSGGEDSPGDGSSGKVLVAYFSCTNTTKGVAEKTASAVNGTLYRITPAVPYTSDDLNYNNNSCRANREQADDTARPAISGTVSGMADYDVVFLGFPIWWGKAPKIIHTFLESYDFSGKTVIPFCTSGSSGYNDSTIKPLAPSANWVTGRRFGSGASEADVKSWVSGLGLSFGNSASSQKLKIEVNGQTLTATFEDNASAEALKELLKSGPVTVAMDDYGNFEKVGPLGTTLTRSDAWIDTVPGDVILYEGNKITIYYANNSWNFTRLAKLDDVTDLKAKLGNGSVSVKFSLA